MRRGLTTLLALSGLGIIGYAIYRYVVVQKNLLSQFTYNIVGVKFGSVTINEISADLNIRLANVADFEINVNQFYVDVYINNVRVGYAQDNGAFLLAAHGTADIPVSVKFDPQIVLQNLVDLAIFSSAKSDMAVGMHGYAQVTSGIVSVTVPVDYDSTVKQIMSS
jgi:LEA14-like dessication related protein